MILSTNLIPLFIIIPLACSFVIAIAGKRIKGFPEAMGVLATVCLLAISCISLKVVHVHQVLVYSVGAWKPPVGIALVMDGLTVFMLCTVNLIAFAISVYAIDYMRRYTAQWKFYTLFLLMLSGMNGVIVTGDIFNLYVFLEIASLASFALVAFGTERHELEAAFKYAVMSTLGSLFILFAIVLLYSFTSTLNMADIAAILVPKGKNNVILMVMVLFIMGFGLKAALVPFHAWLPDAHPSAPAPISAMLSGVLIKSLGIYALCRIFLNVIGFFPMVASIFMFLGALSMIVGVLLAIGQWDFKRLLAYHSISQIGYIVLGISLGTPLGILGGLFHLFNHSVFKSLLFLDSGAVDYATGTRDLQQMGGLAKKMPVTGATSFIASMSIAGIPPFNGFWSKFLIIFATVQSGHYGYAFLAVLASVLTLASFTKVMKYAFWGTLRDKWNGVKEVPILMKLPLILLASVCVIGGVLLIPVVRELFLNSAVRVLSEGSHYTATVMKAL